MPIGKAIQFGRVPQIGRAMIIGRVLKIGRPMKIGEVYQIGKDMKVGKVLQIGKALQLGLPSGAFISNGLLKNCQNLILLPYIFRKQWKRKPKETKNLGPR